MRTVGNTKEKQRKRKERDLDEGKKKKDKSRISDGPSKLQFDNYTPLTKLQSFMLATIKGVGLGRFPKKTDQSMGKDKDAFCRFHRAYAHLTNNW